MAEHGSRRRIDLSSESRGIAITLFWIYTIVCEKMKINQNKILCWGPTKHYKIPMAMTMLREGRCIRALQSIYTTAALVFIVCMIAVES